MSFYVNALSTAMAHAVPTMERYGVKQPDFLDYLKASFNELGLETGMAEGVKLSGRNGDGREDGAQAFVPSPAAGIKTVANGIVV